VISDADQAVIDAALDAMDIDAWRPLDTDEADLVRRALARTPVERAA
jgi:hypothetical protein